MANQPKGAPATYRVAVIGCRQRGGAAARAYHAHPRTTLVALCDLLPERRDALGDELGVTARFADVDTMIRETRPDIVTISTGTEFHYPLLMQVLEHGVNVDVEKPICVDSAQSDTVLALAAARGARVAVHHQGRVGSSMRAIERVMAEGRIGPVRYAHVICKGYYGGYGLMNVGPHFIMNLLKVGGPCRSVTATALTGGRLITPEDVLPSPMGMGIIAGERITATLQFDGDMSATMIHHRLPSVRAASGIEFVGSEGSLLWRLEGAWWLPQSHVVPDGANNRWEALPPVLPPSFDPAGKAAADDVWFVDEYVQALDEGRDHNCSGQEAQHAVDVMMAIFESAARGQRVTLPQAERAHPLLRWRQEYGLGDPAPMPRPYGEWLAVEDRRLGRSVGANVGASAAGSASAVAGG